MHACLLACSLAKEITAPQQYQRTPAVRCCCSILVLALMFSTGVLLQILVRCNSQLHSWHVMLHAAGGQPSTYSAVLSVCFISPCSLTRHHSSCIQQVRNTPALYNISPMFMPLAAQLTCCCGIMCFLQGCVLWKNWWPMLTGLMYVLVPMPYLFFGSAGDSYGYGSLASGCVVAAAAAGAATAAAASLAVMLAHVQRRWCCC
jgi:hypothetical protein